MKTFHSIHGLAAVLAALLLQGAPPSAAQDDAVEQPALETLPSPGVAVDEVAGALDDGRAQEALDRALAIERGLEAADGVASSRWTERDRALLAYNAGLACAERALELVGAEPADPATAQRLEDESEPRFVTARDLAGPSDLRLAASYAPGAVLAARGERILHDAVTMAALARNGAAQGGAPGTGPAAGAVPFGEKSPERQRLEESKRAFVRARDVLVERLRLDWRDDDTRANLEWVTRRLAEIRRIEERADQQEQEQQEQEPQGGNGEDDQQQDGDAKDGDQGDSKDQQSQDQGDDPDRKDSDADQDASQDGDQQKGDASQDENDQDGKSGDESAQDEDRGGRPDEERAANDAEQDSTDPGGEEEGAAGAEQVSGEADPMSEVEVQRLLQRLAEIEEQADRTRRRLQAGLHRRVEKDW
ncbi:MAG: hypothetical protein R3F34_18440 [Planctomycetota bacterium]